MFNTNIGGYSNVYYNANNIEAVNASISNLDVGQVDATIFNTRVLNTSNLNLSNVSAINASLTNITLTGNLTTTNASFINVSTNKISSQTINSSSIDTTNILVANLNADTITGNYIQTPLLYATDITMDGTLSGPNLRTVNLNAGLNISILNNSISAFSTVPNAFDITGEPETFSGSALQYQKYIGLTGFGRPVTFGKNLSNGDEFNIYTQGAGNPDPDVHFSLRRPGGQFQTAITGTLSATGNITAPNLTSTSLTFNNPITRAGNAVSVNNTNVVTSNSSALVTSGAVHTAIQTATAASNSNIIQTLMFHGTASPVSDFACDGGVTIVNLSIPPATGAQDAWYVDFTPKFQGSFITVSASYSYTVAGSATDSITFYIVAMTNNNTFLNQIDAKTQQWNGGSGGQSGSGTRSSCGGCQVGCYENPDTLGKFHRIKLRIFNISSASDDTITITNTKDISVVITESIKALAQTNLSMTNLSASQITSTGINVSNIKILNHPAEIQGITENHAIVFKEFAEGMAFRDFSYFRFLNGGNRASQTEKMRITPTGNVGIATDAPNYKLEVIGDIRASNSLITGQINASNLSLLNISCNQITANNLYTANLTAGENISILNNSISASFNPTTLSLMNLSCSNINTASGEPLTIRNGVVDCLRIEGNNDTSVIHNLSVYGNTRLLGDLQVDGITTFQNLNVSVFHADNLSTATMQFGSGFNFINNVLSFGSFIGNNVLFSDIGVQGLLNVSNVATFGANVNVSDILYIGHPGVNTGRLVIYDDQIGNTLNLFFQDNKSVFDIEADSIQYNKNNISKINIGDDFNVYADMYVYGKVIATDGIDITNLSLISAEIVNCSTANMSVQNTITLNASTLNATTLNASVHNISTTNATQINVSNLSVTKGTITNLSTTNTSTTNQTISNQLTINKQTNSGKAIFNGLVDINNLATIQDGYITGSLNGDNEAHFNRFIADTTIDCNTLSASKINVSNISIQTKATIENLSVNKNINASLVTFSTTNSTKINVSNLSIQNLGTFGSFHGTNLQATNINTSNISSTGDIIGNYVRGAFVEGTTGGFFTRLETDELVLGAGNVSVTGNLSAINIFSRDLVQSQNINGTTLITGPLISGATIEGTTIVEAGINGINNGRVLINGQASQTSNNQWENISTFRSTYSRSVPSDPTNYVVKIGSNDMMTIGNTSTRFNSSIIVNGNITANNLSTSAMTIGSGLSFSSNTLSLSNTASFTNLSVGTLTGGSCDIANYTADMINISKIRLSQGGQGQIQGFSENHAIVMREGGQNITTFYEVGDYRFFNGGLLANQTEKLTLKANGNLGINTSNPLKKLDVGGNTIVRGGMEVLNTNTIISALDLEEVNTTPLTLSCRKARGTVGARTAVQNSDKLLELTSQGYYGTEGSGGNYSNTTAKIEMIADQNFTSSATGSYISFSTTLKGTTSSAEHFRILDNGNLSVMGNKNILSNRFNCRLIYDNISNRFPTTGSSSTVNIVNPLLVSGGTLLFNFEVGGYANVVGAYNYRFELRNSANTTTIDSTTCAFYFNQTGTHQFWSRSDVYSGVSAGSYILRVIRSSTDLLADTNDYFNITLTEFPF